MSDKKLWNEFVALEKERDAMRAELDALLAWKEEAERQEPVGVLHVGSWYGEELQDWEFEADQTACDRLNEANQHKEASLSLYARPVPAPSVPGGWQLVPKEVADLYGFMCSAFVPMTGQQEEIAKQLDLAKQAMKAEPKPEVK